MRVRLLMDTVIPEEEITELAELIAIQPTAMVQIEGHPLMGARFVGAQPVLEPDIQP